MFHHPRTRGTSVLAAVLLAGVLGGLILAIDVVTPTDARSLAAQAAAPVDAAKQAENERKAKCEAVKKEAAGTANGFSSPVMQSFTSNATENNKCVGAVIDENAPINRTAKGIQYTEMAAYKCVGERTTVRMDAKGQGTIESFAEDGIPVGQCKTQFCDAVGKCGPTKEVSGAGTVQQWASDKDVLKALPLEQQQALAKLGPLNASQQDIFKQAFSEQQDVAAKQITENNSTLRDLEKAYASCDHDCDQIEEKKMVVSKNNDALKKQISDLGNAQTRLTPAPDNSGRRSEVNVSAGNGGGAGDNRFQPAQTGFKEETGGSGASSFMNQLLSSLMKGLSGALGGQSQNQGAAPTCPTDPTAYQQQQQQYQMQMQQYQQQMQQLQYQQQLNQYYGSDRPLPPPPIQPQPCRPGTANPANPANPTNPTGGQPTASISCQPKVADVGMSVAITYSCGNSTSSVGNGFTTDGALSGATSTIVNAPQNAKAMNFQITCLNQAATAREECSVEIARPSIVLVANPQTVPSGEASTIGWVTSGMQSCTVSSPQMLDFTTRNAARTNANGSATTSPITDTVDVVLKCATAAGGTRTATTTVGITGASTALTLSVSSDADDNNAVASEATTTITWQSTNAPADSAVALWLYDHRSGVSSSLIARDLALNGSFEWKMPGVNTACPADSPYVCATDLVPGRTYSIEASVYKPKNAYLGGFPPENAVAPQFLKSELGGDFKTQ